MDISPTTFNRLVNGHSKPAVKTLLKLSHFIPELKSLLPEELAKVFKVSMEKDNYEYVGKSLEALLSDENVFLCWMLAFLNKGIKADEMGIIYLTRQISRLCGFFSEENRFNRLKLLPLFLNSKFLETLIFKGF